MVSCARPDNIPAQAPLEFVAKLPILLEMEVVDDKNGIGMDQPVEDSQEAPAADRAGWPADEDEVERLVCLPVIPGWLSNQGPDLQGRSDRRDHLPQPFRPGGIMLEADMPAPRLNEELRRESAAGLQGPHSRLQVLRDPRPERPGDRLQRIPPALDPGEQVRPEPRKELGVRPGSPGGPIRGGP